jgi:adhesin transport system membrane fusion protein
MKPRFGPGQSGFLSMTMVLFIGLTLFLLWAGLFHIDQTVRAQGQAIPSARTQIIQAADGGILSRIDVQEGQAVKAGQLLAILEKDRPNASFKESRTKVAALGITLARAQAEANQRTPEFGNDEKAFPEFVAVQKALYEQRKRSLQEDIASVQDALTMAQQELTMNEKLLKTGDTSQLEVMRARRQVGELKSKINSTRNKYLQDARQEASKVAEELASNRYKLEERQDVLGHTELTAPVAGVVKYLKVNTIGGVLRPGDELMQISPTDGEMLIEAKVNPVDIGQLKTGLPVAIKLDAFDYAIYGILHGTLTYISSDTLVEQGANGQSSTSYRVHGKLDPQQTKDNPKLASVTLKPGMTATIDIRTDSRSVLQYLAKPIFKSFDGAFNER